MSAHKEFEVHLLNSDGIAKAQRLAEVFDEMLTRIEVLTTRPRGDILLPGGSNGREMAIVRTHLEIASFFAKKAMAILPENQK